MRSRTEHDHHDHHDLHELKRTHDCSQTYQTKRDDCNTWDCPSGLSGSPAVLPHEFYLFALARAARSHLRFR